MPEPDPDAEWWTTSDVAAYLGVQIGTVSAYRSRGQMPAPTRTLGRTHLWRPLEIKAWRAPETNPAEPADELPPLQPGEPWRRHGERTIYDSEWMRLDLVDIEQPGGSRFEHHVIIMKPAAVVALLSEDEKRVLLLWRHRFVPDIWNWELPGGLVDDGESPKVAAARELEEETGYRAGSLECVVSYEPLIGMVSARHHVFVGRDPERVSEPVETDEAARAEWVDLDRIPVLIRDGDVANSGTLVAVLELLQSRRASG
ncbi:NUDIX domain-containing protein [Jannaschia sp. R86511]|uniref:NUDIX domain-containing protein n=1 Tax=Jannaschia sp. R86511 TaxID=3093853 RepID=UPI0036D3077B